jgi:hypothetical protein
VCTWGLNPGLCVGLSNYLTTWASPPPLSFLFWFLNWVADFTGLPWAHDPPASTSQVAGITGMNHHAWLTLILKFYKSGSFYRESFIYFDVCLFISLFFSLLSQSFHLFLYFYHFYIYLHVYTLFGLPHLHF